MKMNATAKCHICQRKDDPSNMVGITILNAGVEEPAHAHAWCRDRHREKMARAMYRTRDRSDKRSFALWREETGY
jgi:hypothetical protein